MLARENLKRAIRGFLEENTLYNLMPTNAEVCARDQVPIIDIDLSVLDIINIMRQEDKSYCLCWNSERQRIEGIHLMIDFMNLLLSLDLNHFVASKIADLFTYLEKINRETICRKCISRCGRT